MILVQNIFVDETVVGEHFCCDLPACRGACCCLEGGRGAPLEDEEAGEIRAAFPAVRPYLRDISLRTIERDGLVEGCTGNYATVCIDRRECVFVFFEEGVARCAFERAFREGRTRWPKPISCHLFPVRIRGFGGETVRVEAIRECTPAFTCGNARGVTLHQFLREPLVRKFGSDWYGQLLQQTDAA